MAIEIYFNVHNDNVQLFVKGGKTVTKALKFFWGKSQLQTKIDYWDKKQRMFLTTYNGLPIPTAEKDNNRLKDLKEKLEIIVSTRALVRIAFNC